MLEFHNFSVIQEPESSFLRLKPASFTSGKLKLEDFSLVSENKEPQMTAGTQVGSTGAAFIVNLASRLHHVKLMLPCACTFSGNISITASTCSSFTR